ncbi:hypothetical protein [Flavobacterium chungbukense]|uniref:CpXC domain-containing protein n=1 Tax=Flavobacterium chungbukense TaxID=877464 RepID=A0ABP7YV95_9FLAO|nr:hypothetical protein [Flavobacterium chungbukense]MCC4923232.1 hypothetical protein [Flavobacterium chungbukense]
MSKHPLKCPECNDFKKLEIIWVRYKKEIDKELDLNIPFFVCPNCGHKEPLNSKEYYDAMTDEDFAEMQDGEKLVLKFGYENKEFKRYSHLNFKYSSEDYYLIPGLFRDEDDGYLTPVFFDKDVLLYYNNHPEYNVKFASFSSGNIYHKGKNLFNWGFGINRNGKIFKWLGDLDEDFKEDKMLPHLKRFQASNVESDHDIFSKFYLSQNPFSPSDMFQSSDNETRLFKLKNELDELFQSKFDMKLVKVHIEDFFNFYKPPILEEKEQIFNAYISLNKLIIENIQSDLLKAKLSGKDLKKLGSLKTLENFLSNFFPDENIDLILSSLYVLSDLRQLQGHFSDKSFEERYNFCKERLRIKKEANHFQVYETLIKELVRTFEKINELINQG